MNIFLIDKDPKLCAEALDDLRLNKMILETGQMLSTAFRYHFPDFPNKDTETLLYKQTHTNHPCNIWLRKDIQNYVWLVDYFEALARERLKRTGKTHLTFEKLFTTVHKPIAGFSCTCDSIVFDFDCSGWNTPNPLFTHRFPDQGVFGNYKQCLIEKWLHDKRTPTWSTCAPPAFAQPYIPISPQKQT